LKHPGISIFQHSSIDFFIKKALIFTDSFDRVKSMKTYGLGGFKYKNNMFFNVLFRPILKGNFLFLFALQTY